MSLLRRDDFFKSSFDDPFFENWDSDLKDFRHGFFKNSLLAASPAVANSTVDQGAAPRAIRRQKSWYDRELENASRDGDFTISKSYAKSDGGAEVEGSLKAGRRTEESADGRDKAQYEKSEKALTASAVSADGKSSSIAAERSVAESGKTSSSYVSPDGSCVASAASNSSSTSHASKSESVTNSGDLLGSGSKSSKMASASSASKSASFSSTKSSSSSASSSSSSSAFKNSSMLDGTDMSMLSTGLSALPGLTAMPALPEMHALNGLAMPAFKEMSPFMAASSAMSSSAMSSKSSSKSSSMSSSLKSQKEAASAISSKSAVKSNLASDVSLGSASKFEAGISTPLSPPPSYAESVVDDEEDCKVYYPISYKEIGRQDSIPVSQSFFTLIDGNTRKLKLQFYVGRGYEAKNVHVTAVGQKLMVRCRQGEMEYAKDVNLPEEIDANLISSLLSKDGVLTVQCIMSEKSTPASTLQGPITKDEDGNKIIQLKYDVQAFEPKDVKVILQGDMLRIHAIREEHSASVCVKKEFKRDFALPAEADKDSLVYKVEDGVLSVRIKVKETVYQRALSEEGCVGNKIHLEFDVGDFEPEDVEVKLGGGTLSVGGRRRAKFEKEAQVLDFSRECVVPTWVDSDSLRSYLTPGGKLTIEIPMEKTVRSELHVNVNQD